MWRASYRRARIVGWTIQRKHRNKTWGVAPYPGKSYLLGFPDFVFPGFHFLFSRILLLVSRILVIVSCFSLSGFSLSPILVSRIPSFRFCVESQYLLYGTWNSSFPDFTFPDFTSPDFTFLDFSFPDSGSGFPDFTYGFPGFYLKFPAFLSGTPISKIFPGRVPCPCGTLRV
jgi:hypothetical protein